MKMCLDGKSKNGGGGPFENWLVKTEEKDEPGINGAINPREMGETVKSAITVDSFDEYALKS